MKLSAIILTWNSDRYIKRCLDSLMEDLIESGIDFEIFVVDNGSTDKTKVILNEYSEKINTIFLDKNKGTTFSRNLAIKRSIGEYILFLDSDTEIKNIGTTERIISILQNRKDIGIIAPRLVFPDGTTQMSYKKFPTFIVKILKIIPLKFLRKFSTKLEYYNFSNIDKNRIYLVDYCISACWLMPKIIIEKVGLLDEKIFYSPEDVDFCLRVWKAGYKVAWCPAVDIVHYCQRVSYKNISIATSHFKGLLYYFKKHNYWLFRPRIHKEIIK